MLNAAAEAILPHLTDCAGRTTESDRWPKAEPETAVMPTEMEDYLFDQRGYLVLENALGQSVLNTLDITIDKLSSSPQQEAEPAALVLASSITALTPA